MKIWYASLAGPHPVFFFVFRALTLLICRCFGNKLTRFLGLAFVFRFEMFVSLDVFCVLGLETGSEPREIDRVSWQRLAAHQLQNFTAKAF